MQAVISCHLLYWLFFICSHSRGTQNCNPQLPCIRGSLLPANRNIAMAVPLRCSPKSIITTNELTNLFERHGQHQLCRLSVAHVQQIDTDDAPVRAAIAAAAAAAAASQSLSLGDTPCC